MRVVLLGAPGAGKGTQCKRIVAKYGSVHLSSGDILRQERAAGSQLGAEAQAYMDSGRLVPDGIIVQMMADAIEKARDGNFVLDGFPRTVNQAIELDRALGRLGHRVDVVLNLQIDDQIASRRLTGRRSCPRCGAVYHIENLRPKENGRCDNDRAVLIQRSDDTPEVVANRLETYHDQTEPLIDYYEAKELVYNIDAGEDADEVTALVFAKLDEVCRLSC